MFYLRQNGHINQCNRMEITDGYSCRTHEDVTNRFLTKAQEDFNENIMVFSSNSAETWG